VSDNHSNHRRQSTGKKCLDLRAREKDEDREKGGRIYFRESQTAGTASRALPLNIEPMGVT